MSYAKKPLPEQEIEDLYLSGVSIQELARRYSVAFATIKSRLKTRGVCLRTLSEAQCLPPNKGRPISPEHRAKLSKAKLGKPSPKPFGFGEKISRVCALRGVYGSNHPSWKGGYSPFNRAIRRSKPYKDWKYAVYKRDRNQCQHCGHAKQTNLHAHHIKSLVSILREHNIRDIDSAEKCLELWDINNGVTLCRWCHGKEEARLKSRACVRFMTELEAEKAE